MTLPLYPACLACFHSCFFPMTLCPLSSTISALYWPVAVVVVLGCRFFLLCFFTVSSLSHLQLLVLSRLSLTWIRFMVSQWEGTALHRTVGYLGVFRVWSACRFWNQICCKCECELLCIVVLIRQNQSYCAHNVIMCCSVFCMWSARSFKTNITKLHICSHKSRPVGL